MLRIPEERSRRAPEGWARASAEPRTTRCPKGLNFPKVSRGSFPYVGSIHLILSPISLSCRPWASPCRRSRHGRAPRSAHPACRPVNL